MRSISDHNGQIPTSHIMARSCLQWPNHIMWGLFSWANYITGGGAIT